MKKAFFTVFTVAFTSTMIAQNKFPTTGNVGIGTTTPGRLLDVVGGLARFQGGIQVTDDDVVFSGLVRTTNPVGKDFLFLNTTGAVEKVSIADAVTAMAPVLYNLSCNPVGGVVQSPTWSNGPNKIFVACPDDIVVGIGTAFPEAAARLDVEGVTRTSFLAINTDAATMAGRFHLRSNLGEASSSTVMRIDNSYRKLMELDNRGLLTTERIYIKNTTVSPSDSNYVLKIENSSRPILKLQSNGLLRVRSIKADASTWADFVFEPDYPLMAPEDLRNYVTTNKHLPGIPSAEEITTNGVDLVEMNTLLLQKIEELTLYMLQQQQEIEQLKANQE